jgi:hypothetical protein
MQRRLQAGLGTMTKRNIPAPAVNQTPQLVTLLTELLQLIKTNPNAPVLKHQATKKFFESENKFNAFLTPYYTIETYSFLAECD